MNKREKPLIVEKFADNGEHSHWSVIDANNGKIIIEDIAEMQLLSSVSEKLEELRCGEKDDQKNECPGGVYYIEHLDSETMRLTPRR